MQQKKHTGWWMHLAAWAVVFGMPLMFSGPERTQFSQTEYFRALLSPLSFMVVFYVNYLLLIDRYLLTRRFGRFLIGNILLIGVVMLGVHLLFRGMQLDIVPHRPLHFEPQLRGPHRPPGEFPWGGTIQFFAGKVLLYISALGAGVAIRMTDGWYRAEAARQKLEHSRMEAELQNLKSQLNPHFLFNTLNNIYSLILLDPDRAQQVVHDLSRLLRYVLYESSRPTVPLDEEVGFLRDYIELMRIRLPRHVRVEVSLPGDAPQTPIAPLLFISLVENAFKHGVCADKPSFIDIDLHEADGEVVCRIRNSWFPKTAVDCSGSGIGLTNLSKRLEMIYPGRYTFEYGQSGGDGYEALLRIQTPTP